MEKRIILTLDQVPAFIDQTLVPLLTTHRIITLEGPLGAGKTTLVRELLTKMGVAGLITSPTFSYVNDYKSASGKLFHHFDLYRIASIDDFIMAGFDEYLHERESVCLIEWPQVIAPLLQRPELAKQTCHVMASHDPTDADHRIINLITNNPW
ncbi:tRNA (adenosine(37)-N6)-threonylcarbamoyltransferase complex ATPase subunit type 1 TsaE [bacterium]|nr:tRNA (adenosine(37)-N6)-threonylcarbamoyltransferase complex ATPase subunit type 1 TsaE [bacterium]